MEKNMLKNKMYADYKKRLDIHGTVLYPAVMIAPVQKDILEDLISGDEINSIIDPFCGSGTALYEALEINSNLHLVGCDINPLAKLITEVKLRGVDENILADISTLKKTIPHIELEEIISFPNCNKWIRSDILESLSIIKDAINRIESDRNRKFFWCMLCDLIRKYSNTSSSTYKLYIKDRNKEATLENNLISDYLKKIEIEYNKFFASSDNCIIYKDDVNHLLPSFLDNTFDITITSPPYGDNLTTVPYGQFSMLSLYVIDSRDLDLEGWELGNYSVIDNHSLGGKRVKSIDISPDNMALISPYTSQISSSKREKVLRFFADYFRFLKETCRITRKYIVLTLGNRTVDRINIDLKTISMQYLETHGFKNIKATTRDIPYKRTPVITSCIDSSPVSSINKEYVIIHKKSL